MNQEVESNGNSVRRLVQIFAALATSILVYGALFGWVLHKPLSLGTIRDYFQIKLERLESVPPPRLVFFGGSNVRVGLRCELAERLSHVPCVNAGFLADVGLDLMTQVFEPRLRKGDVVYIPLAYEQYLWSREFIETQSDAAYLFSYDRATLVHMPLSRQVRALFHFDLRYMVTAVAENVLARFGVRRAAGGTRVFGAQNINQWGDDTGHTRERGKDFQAVLARAPVTPPDAPRFFPERYYSTQVLEQFLVRLRDKGVLVVGGLPQTVDEFEIPEEVIAKVREIYVGHGQRFVQLPNRSQYPRDCFYDSFYHLNEECQLRHTSDLMPYLKAYLPASGSPSSAATPDP